MIQYTIKFDLTTIQLSIFKNAFTLFFKYFPQFISQIRKRKRKKRKTFFRLFAAGQETAAAVGKKLSIKLQLFRFLALSINQLYESSGFNGPNKIK